MQIWKEIMLEIRGPFIEKGKWSIATDMWDKMLQLIPKGIVTTSMFVNNKNYNCLGLADILGFSKNGEEIILEFKRVI